MIIFAYPWMFVAVLLPFAVYFLWPAAKKMYGDALRVPFTADIAEIKNNSGGMADLFGGYAQSSKLRLILAALMWLCVMIALCRPQWVGEPHQVQNRGRNIMLVVDISTSMNERDFTLQGKRYDRLTAVKYVVNQFVDTTRVADMQPLFISGLKEYYTEAGDESMTTAQLFERLQLPFDGPKNQIPLPAGLPCPTSEGLLFCYGQYEIACYADGMPAFVVPYDKIKPFLSKDATQLLQSYLK